MELSFKNFKLIRGGLHLTSFKLLFLVFLVLIRAVVFYFSYVYKVTELKRKYFFLVFSRFVVRMILLIVRFKNKFLLFLGWDLLGLTSFVLICYYRRPVSFSSSTKTFLINRFGDSFLLLTLSKIIITSVLKRNLVSFSRVFRIFLILGLFTKSAQFPFNNWLPAAMAAPTPVSSLVHSSTLVTAGVFILLSFRKSLEFLFSSLILSLIVITLVFSSILAFIEKDVKKVIAYSTLSHLSIMLVSLVLGNLEFCFLHLFSHALFKAKLFLIAGFRIISNTHEQIFKNSRLPGVMFLFPLLFSFLNLKALFFTSGFFSKDLILDSLGVSNKLALGFVLFLSLSFTAFYRVNLIQTFVKISRKFPVKTTLGWVLVGVKLSFSLSLESFLFLKIKLGRKILKIYLLVIRIILLKSIFFWFKISLFNSFAFRVWLNSDFIYCFKGGSLLNLYLVSLEYLNSFKKVLVLKKFKLENGFIFAVWVFVFLVFSGSLI